MSADEHRWWESTQRRLNLAERARLAALINENARLRGENAELRAENTANKKAALWCVGFLVGALHENTRLRAVALRLRDAWRVEATWRGILDREAERKRRQS